EKLAVVASAQRERSHRRGRCGRRPRVSTRYARPRDRSWSALAYGCRVSWGDTELGLIALAAMLSPTTLSFSVLALVLGDRPLRTGIWFYLGAFSAMLAVGVMAAFVIGNVAASPTSTPKTWVSVVDVIAGVLLLVWVGRAVRRPADPEKATGLVA